VLFLFNEEHIFLIKRYEGMPTHAGQIAFVGGHKKIGEFHPSDVAYREFEEETSLSRESLEYLGYLPIVMTARLQPIVPVMARLVLSTEQFLAEIKSNGEWDEVVAYPWKELVREQSWEYAWRHGNATSAVMFHPIRQGSYLPLEQNVKSHLLWGATAQMIWSFLRLYFNK
jgi:8-oxo-dGTP pyrophosphatase MutT (NUDIX family)